MSQTTATYLMITILDNDFTNNYNIIGRTIRESLRSHCLNPYGTIELSPEQLETIKPYIASIWWSVDNLTMISESVSRGTKLTSVDYKNYIDSLRLSIVKYEDIPEFENLSCIYIPLYTDGDIILN